MLHLSQKVRLITDMNKKNSSLAQLLFDKYLKDKISFNDLETSIVYMIEDLYLRSITFSHEEMKWIVSPRVSYVEQDKVSFSNFRDAVLWVLNEHEKTEPEAVPVPEEQLEEVGFRWYKVCRDDNRIVTVWAKSISDVRRVCGENVSITAITN